jgi:hypothetical protein
MFHFQMTRTIAPLSNPISWDFHVGHVVVDRKVLDTEECWMKILPVILPFVDGHAVASVVAVILPEILPFVDGHEVASGVAAEQTLGMELVDQLRISGSAGYV